MVTFILLVIVQTDRAAWTVSLPTKGSAQQFSERLLPLRIVAWKVFPDIASGTHSVCLACSISKPLLFNSLPSSFISTLVLILWSFSLTRVHPCLGLRIQLLSIPHLIVAYCSHSPPDLGGSWNSSWLWTLGILSFLLGSHRILSMNSL